ncbi:MAG TPA: PTS system mannose/fructose/sorbose family transporter subunit IID [Candidatus Desulfovibrio intestinipullorum]|uniref:PTS system mannose/fructose/sorbose family transporter subunit IID n=1 Tax=Candidatus Desulfovibrio intestinipullorum TaxID=2838536 RepID=A0A9D1PUA5_9BACT|nr:PTS system mannose/fructose/sorbose family transporter subunit IID [Candidatus Desulfovibrio intestinipullorum]
MNAPLPLRVALTCLWRTAAINAGMTARGMQQLGLLYVLAPALRHLYPEPEARRRAFARYAEHTNTHAFMLPGYAGLLISMESQIAAGSVPEAIIASLRQTLATTLSALGDSFFSGAVRTSWALISICLVLCGYPLAAALFTGLLILLLMAFRVTCFFYCLRNGIVSLQWLRRLNIVSWTERIKIFNALLIGLTLWCMLVEDMQDWAWQARTGVFLFIPVAAWLIGKVHVPRTLLWLAALGVFIFLESGAIRF